MNRILIPVAIAAVLLFPMGSAGTPASPEVSDGAGDAQAYLDITSAWVTSNADTITVQIKINDLGTGNPTDTGDTRYQFRVDFNSARGPLYIDGQVHFVDTTGEPTSSNSDLAVACACYGTAARASANAIATASLDTVNDVVTLTMKRDFGGSRLTGTLSGIRVSTGVSQAPITPGGLSAIVLGPAFSSADQAIGTGSHTLA